MVTDGTRADDEARSRPGVPSGGFLPIVELRTFSRIDPARALLHVAVEVAAAVAAAAACERWFNPVAYVITVMFIGARLMSLAVIMHDAVHHRLFRNRALNDLFGHLLGLPALVPFRAFQQNHLAHHRHVNSDQDPDLPRVMPNALSLKLHVLLFVLSVSSALTIRNRLFALGPATRNLFLAAMAVVAALWAFHLPGAALLVRYWVVPLLTWLPYTSVLRSISEHYSIPPGHALAREPLWRTRVVIPSLFDLLFVTGENISYHLPHHLYPSVPLYRLPALHRRLMQDEAYRASAVVVPGFHRLVADMIVDSATVRAATGAARS